ncbi:MAG TPA: response regulator [Methanothrix sp.]
MKHVTQPDELLIAITVRQNQALRILLAEDDEIIQKVTLLMLKKLGYRADVAANGREVLSAFEHNSYDIVLMDIQMPEMDGLEAARIIRLSRPDGLRIIAVTASVQEETREKCLQAGMDDYISKPLRTNELANLLSRASGCHA